MARREKVVGDSDRTIAQTIYYSFGLKSGIIFPTRLVFINDVQGVLGVQGLSLKVFLARLNASPTTLGFFGYHPGRGT